MKKLTFAAALSALLLAACSQPVSQNQTFGANANSNVTVAQAKSLADDSRVTLEGSIVRQIRGDKYIFADSTGEIEVEIEHYVWNGLTVGPKDKVRIQGELDRDTFSADIDVKMIEKIQ